MLAAPFRSRFQLLFGAAVRSFIVTWLLMTALGIALAVAAGYYLPDVQPFSRGLLQFFIIFQFVVVGAFVAGRRALSAAVVHGVRSLNLGQRGLGDLFRGLDESPALPGEEPNIQPGSLADEQLARALRTVTAGRRLRRGPWAWFRGYLMDLVGGITLSRVRGKRQRGEKVETAEVRGELESTIDELLLTRVYFVLYVWTFLVVAGLVALNVLLIYLAKLMSQAA
jgi:hypothetical protein